MFRLLLVVAVTAGMARLGYSYFADTARDNAMIADLQSKRQKLDTSWQKLELFRSAMNQTLVELVDDEISLAQAIDRVVEASRSHHPTYLRVVAATMPEALVKERVGFELIKTLNAELEDNRDSLAHLNKVIGRLKAEFTAMFPAAISQ